MRDHFLLKTVCFKNRGSTWEKDIYYQYIVQRYEPTFKIEGVFHTQESLIQENPVVYCE